MKKNFNWFQLITVLSVLALVGVLIYGGMNNWFGVYLSSNPTVTLNPEIEESSYSVVLNLNPQPICVGEDSTGSISSNMNNAVCTIYVNVDASGWEFYKNIVLDTNGNYEETQTLSTAGMILFRAVCYLDGKYKVSNTVTLNAEVCPDGDVDFCENNDTIGVYCNDLNVCVEARMVCPPCTSCVGRVCMQQPCSTIVNPTSQAMCDQGYCGTGSCAFVPADIVNPAKCLCV